jgi:hypothetical protein
VAAHVTASKPRFRDWRFQIVPGGKAAYPTGNQLLTPTSRNFPRTAVTTFEAIKEKLNYKRKEMAIEAGKIVTPDFEYTVYASQDENEPTEALLIEEISNIEAKIIENEEFNEIFQARFDELVVSAARKINVTKVIDTVEALPSGIYVDFPKDCSSCEITFDNSRLSLVVHPNRVIVRAVMKSTPLELAKGLVEVKKLIAPTPVRKLLQ